jgi:hypothetical protein
MHNRAILTVHVNAIAQVEAPTFHVAGHAVTGGHERRARDGIIGQDHTLGIEKLIDTIAEMEEISEHDCSSQRAGARCLSGAAAIEVFSDASTLGCSEWRVHEQEALFAGMMTI